jgi:transcription factor MYB, plant
MDFSCFQPHMGVCSYLPFDPYMQQDGRYELHPVEHHHPFEAIGDYTPATFDDLGRQLFFAESKKPVSGHASPIGRSRVGSSQLPLLTPKAEVSPLMDISGLAGSYKAYETNGRFLPRKKTSSNKANVVKGQWTAEEDRYWLKSMHGYSLLFLYFFFSVSHDLLSVVVSCNNEFILGNFDRKLVKLVEQFGLRKWSYIAQLLPGRVGKQCRERWHNHLRPNIKVNFFLPMLQNQLLQNRSTNQLLQNQLL